MEIRHDQQKPPDSSAEKTASNDLVKLIRKLRWIGMEQEAQGKENELTTRRAAADSVVTWPCDTD
jgi:hypothetical protein